jgi:hypothetical protein
MTVNINLEEYKMNKKLQPNGKYETGKENTVSTIDNISHLVPCGTA